MHICTKSVSDARAEVTVKDSLNTNDMHNKKRPHVERKACYSARKNKSATFSSYSALYEKFTEISLKNLHTCINDKSDGSAIGKSAPRCSIM